MGIVFGRETRLGGLLLMLTLVSILALCAVAASAPGAKAQTSALAGKKVVLDPGHGGTDGGSANSKYGLLEKDQNLEVAYRLKALLEGEGATVRMTRGGDRYGNADDCYGDDASLSNNARYTCANSWLERDPGPTSWSPFT